MTAWPPVTAAAAAKAAKARAVGVEDRRVAARQQGVEQAQLGRAIGPHGAVIVEVVLGQVEEAGGGQAHAVEPALVEAVRGGFQRQVGDAALGQVGQQRRDVAASGVVRPGGVSCSSPALDAERAHAGGGVAAGGENLPAEGGHRGLAVGAGDRDARLGLRALEGRGRQSIGAARIVDAVTTGAATSADLLAGQDGGGARGQRLRNEAAAVGLGARQGGEQLAGPHLAAVGGDAGDQRVDGQVAAHEIGEALGRSWLDRREHVGTDVVLAACGGSSAGAATRRAPRNGAMRSMIRPATGAATGRRW